VFERTQRLDLALVVNWCRFFSHKKCEVVKMKQSGRNFNAKKRFCGKIIIFPRPANSLWASATAFFRRLNFFFRRAFRG
jgi:hypothetical protein